jgi:hypothetical protein
MKFMDSSRKCLVVLTEKPNKMQQCIKTLLFLILNKAQHVSGDTSHHQETKTAQAASGFA